MSDTFIATGDTFIAKSDTFIATGDTSVDDHQITTSYPLEVDTFIKNIKYEEKNVLQYHQLIVSEFFKHKAARGLLLFHGTGSGKTMLAVSIADIMKDSRTVMILSAKSLQYNFQKEVRHYLELVGKSAEEIEQTIKQYKYLSSNANNLIDQIVNAIKTKEELEINKQLNVEVNTDKIDLNNVLMIIDEAQHFFNGIVNGSSNSKRLYSMIMKNKNIKLVFLSATPVINDPFEIVPLYNMLKGKEILPTDYEDFYRFYVDTKADLIKNKEKLKNRIYGLTSYVGDWWQSGKMVNVSETIKRDNYPDQLPIKVELVKMSDEQFMEYNIARILETKFKGKKTIITESMQKPKSDPSSTYRVASRQVSNFLLPDSLKEEDKVNKKIIKHIDRLTEVQLKNLDIYSPKMKKILDNVNKGEGLQVVYSSFVSGEGLKIFSMILDINGWQRWSTDMDDHKNKNKYVFISGDINPKERSKILEQFNQKQNMDGEIIRLLLLSGAGAEGVDLKGVKHIHIMEPYWNFARIEQIIARGVRYLSHDYFSNPKDRFVQPYIYLSTYPDKVVPKKRKGQKEAEKTTDVHLYESSIKNKKLIDSFYAAMIESSIDCPIHKRKATAEVQANVKCVLCTPNNKKLYEFDISMDMRYPNPCEELQEETVAVKEMELDGQKYYYNVIDGKISIYTFNPTIDSYAEITNKDPHYYDLIQSIEEIN